MDIFQIYFYVVVASRCYLRQWLTRKFFISVVFYWAALWSAIMTWHSLGGTFRQFTLLTKKKFWRWEWAGNWRKMPQHCEQRTSNWEIWWGQRGHSSRRLHSSSNERLTMGGRGCISAIGMRSGKGGSWTLSDLSSGSSLTEWNSSSEMWWTERIFGSWLSMTGI